MADIFNRYETGVLIFDGGPGVAVCRHSKFGARVFEDGNSVFTP